MKQRQDKVVSTLFQRRAPTLYQCCATLKNLTSDFVSFSTSDHRYFSVDPQR